jgi:hypothetical protein
MSFSSEEVETEYTARHLYLHLSFCECSSSVAGHVLRIGHDGMSIRSARPLSSGVWRQFKLTVAPGFGISAPLYVSGRYVDCSSQGDHHVASVDFDPLPPATQALIGLLVSRFGL